MPRLAGARADTVATCAPTTARGLGTTISLTSCATRSPVGRATGASETLLGRSASRRNARGPCTTPTASWFVVTSSAAVVESYHRSQLLVRSEFDDEPATPSDDANNVTTSNILHIGPLVEVLKLPGGTAANVLLALDNGWSPHPLRRG